MRPRLAVLLALSLTLAACTSGGRPPHPPPPRQAGPPTSIFGSAVPLTPSFEDPAATTLGVRFTSTLPGVVTGIRFYKGAGNTGVHVGALWDAQGRRLAEVTFQHETDSGWQQADLAQPVRITAGATYTASYLAPVGHYAAIPNAFDGGPVVLASGPLTAVGGGFASGSAMAFPGQSHENTDYYVDVSFSPDESVTHVPDVFTPAYWSKWPATNGWRDPAKLPVSVWMQDPTTPYDGSDDAHAFRSLGVDTFVGLWGWPTDDHGQVRAAAAAGMAVIAGGHACDPAPGGPGGWPCATADLPLAAQAERVGAATLTGYQLADEPDMNAPNGTAAGAGCLPPAKLRDFAASLRRQDGARPVLVNFGTGVAGGARSVGCPTDFSQYTAAADIVSVDFYGVSDPSSPPSTKGVRTYASTAARTRLLSPGKPVWVFLETPVRIQAGSRTATGAKAASPAQVRAAAWAALVNGATGLSWFCHSFVSQPQVDACLRDATSAATIKQVDADAQTYAAYWNAPPVLVGVAAQGAPVTATLRTAGGRTAVLAVATDRPDLPEGGPSTVTFTVPGRYSGQVRTDDGRVLTARQGVFTDTFTAYQPHAYTLG
ncbi:DUF4082 domain-containing protein [Kitasatospora sp. MAP5-34]|uniref:DUF4082 domain-containing protein n=1 Tax=Kitasatospora sp. MAP5-34 TaxID=3035102 RepID=UPI00247556CF|nr:DUF4082 domain-containing protein [Kitasatospora sp. MAP5-34]MDH6576163.1 hypothetical protein [Kitasatospora sp. MAP5-34]